MTMNAEHTGNCTKDLADGAWRGADFANIGELLHEPAAVRGADLARYGGNSDRDESARPISVLDQLGERCGE
jgi:hypothetical protein